MAYMEQEARDMVVQAGLHLVKHGLIARTWGNISARISETQFVITPSGMAYETLTPEKLVAVNIADCSYDGEIKPSSEKGVHADAYRLRSDVNFVIHTHQNSASVVGVLGRSLRAGMHFAPSPLLGKCVPCAAYGISSTKKLRHGVAAAVGSYPESPAVLMPHHGALCMGHDCDHAFEIAEALENACGAYIAAAFAQAGQEAVPALPDPMPDYGRSEREGGYFRMERGGKPYVYAVDAPPSSLPREAAVHAEIYRTGGAAFILHQADPQVVAVSAAGRTMRPLLDDLAQITGVDVRCAYPEHTDAAKKLKGRSAVLIHGAGALCVGATLDDAQAVSMIMQKGCAAERFASLFPPCRYLGTADALLQRTIYALKYSKLK